MTCYAVHVLLWFFGRRERVPRPAAPRRWRPRNDDVCTQGFSRRLEEFFIIYYRDPVSFVDCPNTGRFRATNSKTEINLHAKRFLLSQDKFFLSASPLINRAIRVSDDKASVNMAIRSEIKIQFPFYCPFAALRMCSANLCNFTARMIFRYYFTCFFFSCCCNTNQTHQSRDTNINNNNNRSNMSNLHIHWTHIIIFYTSFFI